MAEGNELDNRLARIIIGKDDTASIELMGYQFRLHAPTLLEQLKVQVLANNLRSGALQSDLDLKVMTTMIATLDVVCDEIVKTKDEEGREISPVEIQMKDGKNIGFWDLLQNKKNPKLMEILLIPLFEKYIEFQNELSLKYKDLKN